MSGITSTKKIKGQPHLLAYITPNEVEKLKALGGQETMTKEGIPAYPEFDNYGFSSQADFDSGDVSKSNDPNVRGEGTNFDGSKQNRVTASQLAAINAKEKEAEKQKVLAELSVTPFNRNKPLSKFGLYNNQFQKKQNIKLAQKRAFQKYQDIEQYVDLMDDYGLTAEEIAGKLAANPEYGYDLRNLKENSYGKENLISNKGTRIETTRPNLYDVNSKIPGKFSFLNKGFDKVRPDTYVTVKNTLKKARDYRDLAVDPNISREKLEALANRGKTLDQINPPSGGDNNQPFIPINYNTGAAEIVEPYTNDFTYRFGDDQNVIYENYGTPGYRTTAAEGGIMGTRARRAMGGIMNRVDQRQGYFLGKIVKGVGKAIGSVADAAGKVLKSDVGKMALMAAGTYYLGGGMKFGGAKMFGNTGFGTTGLMSNLGRLGTYAKENPFKTIGLASTVLPFLAGGAKPNEDIGMAERGGRLLDSKGNETLPAGLRAEVQEAYASGDSEKIKDIQKYYSFLPSPDLVNLPGTVMGAPYTNYGSQGYRTTVATGGRIGKAEGGLMDLGGMEKDYRAEGGFVPIGEYEKKDDVPARLSVNEFVFTADAVRGAGQGDIDKGAEIMENMMENLENGGTVSEESQGNKGAQQMFKTSERLGAVI